MSSTPDTAQQLAGETKGSLDALRAELDRIDLSLLDALRARLECCGRIAHFKREHGIPMMQPDRIRVVHQRAASYSETHGIDAQFLRQLYELIITETCRLEDLIINEPQP